MLSTGRTEVASWISLFEWICGEKERRRALLKDRFEREEVKQRRDGQAVGWRRFRSWKHNNVRYVY